MKVECAWCKIGMGFVPPYEKKEVSHSVCQGCLDKQMREYDKTQSQKGEYDGTYSKGSVMDNFR